MKNSCCFQYPSRLGGWYFRLPWHVLGGWKSWVFKKWSVTSKDKANMTEGIIILGFTKIDSHWLCSPENAIKFYRAGQERLIKYLLTNEEEWGD